jgi:nickel/cobalt transporter (NicO) family protein
MRALTRFLIGALIVAAALALWWAGAYGDVQRWILDWQREFQRIMANAVRALRAGDPGAVWGLIWLSFLYGVLHAAGPGHGKVVLGGWAFATSARLARIVGITLAASMTQAVVAIALVWGAVALFGLGRAELTGLAEGGMLVVAGWMLLGLGLWLVWRGVRGGWRLARPVEVHDHDHGQGENCDCGHAHAPDPRAAAKASWPEALALIGAVAARPCSGALLVMLLTVMIGAPWSGAAAVLAMGVGTAVVTLAVTLAGSQLRALLAPVAGQGTTLRWTAHGIELAAGLVIVGYAVGMVV